MLSHSEFVLIPVGSDKRATFLRRQLRDPSIYWLPQINEPARRIISRKPFQPRSNDDKLTFVEELFNGSMIFSKSARMTKWHG